MADEIRPPKSSLRNNIMIAFFLVIVIGGISFTTIFQHVIQTSLVQEGLDKIVVEKITRNFIFISTGLTIVAFFIVLFLAMFISITITRPIKKLAEGVANVSRGNLYARIDVSSQDEFGQLADSFNKMTEELRMKTVSKAYLDGIIGNMQSSLIVMNPDGTIHTVNGATCNMLGYSEDGLVGEEIEKIFVEDPQVKTPRFPELIKRGSFRNLERTCVSKDGRKTQVLYSGSIMHNAEGEVYRIIVEVLDITERKQAEEEREAVKGQLHQAQKMEAIGQLTGGIAHDFNNMLSAILGYASILEMHLKEDDPLMEKVRPIIRVSEKAAALVGRLLAFSRNQIVDLKSVKLNDIVKDSERLLSSFIGEDVEFTVSLADEDLVVEADSGQIEQVLMNLVSNARDAMPDGGVLAVSTGSESLDEDFIRAHGYGGLGRYAWVIVADTGAGMDEETLENIFDPFFTTKEVDKGTGLGLSVAYGIVKQHNGCMVVKSEPGKGTEFKIYLPASKREVRAEGPRRFEGHVAGTETLLVAEDDAEVRSLTKMVLEELGYEVIEAVDGEDAVNKFMENKIDMLLLDVIMPRMNGKEAYDEILKVAPNIKALFLSGYTKDIINKKGILEEGLNFISKPLSPVELSRKVRDVLDGST